jgi:TPR repeat protein
MYEKGHGVQQNINKAIEWYQKAAEQGHECAKEKFKNLIEKIKKHENSADD